VNEQILDTLANVGITLAAFSGVVVAFRAGGSEKWSAPEMRVLMFLVVDSFVVVVLALLPVPLTLADMSEEWTWGLCSALLGSWFVLGVVLAIVGDRRDRSRGKARITVPVVTPLLYVVGLLGLPAGIALWLSAFDIVPRGQAVFVAGLIVLLVFAAIEFLFLIALGARRTGTGRTAGD